MNQQQLEIMQHTLGLDQYGRRPFGTERNYFMTCQTGSDGVICESLVVLGFMVNRGPQALAAGDHYYQATITGRQAMEKESPAPPKVTKSQKRYAAFLNEDSGMSFHEWLLAQKHRGQYAH